MESYLEFTVLTATHIIDAFKASSKDETRPQLNGVHLFNQSTDLVIEATDGHVLVTKTLIEQSNEKLDEKGIIVNKDFIDLLKYHVKTAKKNKHLAIKVPLSTIHLIDREYPRTAPIIPRNAEVVHSIKVNAKLLKQAIDALNPTDRNNSITLEFLADNVNKPMILRANNMSEASEALALVMPLKI